MRLIFTNSRLLIKLYATMLLINYYYYKNTRQFLQLTVNFNANNISKSYTVIQTNGCKSLFKIRWSKTIALNFNLNAVGSYISYALSLTYKKIFKMIIFGRVKFNVCKQIFSTNIWMIYLTHASKYVTKIRLRFDTRLSE